ncbi:MAG: efflux RND transporter periplasmic adaptor subunit [Scytonematopsis contorta HA4267-MV1]|jgi:HlyD family secretion protein|nr:efflux RND transporter periplasmic adaptor subunit [Scytonematopsis contorta HA4267-MV1]
MITELAKLSVNFYRREIIGNLMMYPLKNIPVFSKFKKINPLLLGIISVGIIGTVASIYVQSLPDTKSEEIAQQSIPVESKDWVMEIPANGVIQAVKKNNLSPEDSGKIVKLFVKEGDTVTKGQVIAFMNNDRLQAQVNQYKALVLKAQADLAQKRSGNRPEEVEQAKFRLAKTEADLQQLVNSKPQEIEQAEAQARAAASRRELAKNQFNRNQVLQREGAISKDKLDELASAYKVNLATQEEAEKKIEQIKNSRKQEIAQRQASVEEARQALRQSKSGSRPQEIAQAEAEVKQAKAQLQFYQTQLNNTVIRAPFAGIITRRFAQEGDFVSPSTAASTSEGASSTSIVELSNGLEIEAKIPEANISKIQLVQKVQIRTDTYVDDVFNGKVKLISPRAVQENNITSFRVKVALLDGKEKLKSGMNVRLMLQSDPQKNALVIPLAAVVTQSNGQTGVHVPNAKSETHTRFQKVKVSPASGDKVRVLEGLKLGDRILLSPPPNQQIEGVDTVDMGS